MNDKLKIIFEKNLCPLQMLAFLSFRSPFIFLYCIVHLTFAVNLKESRIVSTVNAPLGLTQWMMDNAIAIRPSFAPSSSNLFTTSAHVRFIPRGANTIRLSEFSFSKYQGMPLEGRFCFHLLFFLLLLFCSCCCVFKRLCLVSSSSSSSSSSFFLCFIIIIITIITIIIIILLLLLLLLPPLLPLPPSSQP